MNVLEYRPEVGLFFKKTQQTIAEVKVWKKEEKSYRSCKVKSTISFILQNNMD